VADPGDGGNPAMAPTGNGGAKIGFGPPFGKIFPASGRLCPPETP